MHSAIPQGVTPMFRFDSAWLILVALALSMSSTALAQESTLNTAPLTTLPTFSNERLGTGVPSRLPKVDVQRPVFTIQSGGPVALPMPQFRPSREITPASTRAKETKGSLPIIEQSRPWQKSDTENPTPNDQTLPPSRPATARSAPTTVSPTIPSAARSQPQLTAELPSVVRRVPATTAPLPQTRPVPTTVPAGTSPARVLNFSIN